MASVDLPLFYLIAGEQSGDNLGAKLMAALKQATGGQCRFAGVGGEKMRAQGLEPLFPMSDLSVMGFVEVLPHLPKLLKRIRQTAKDIAAKRPDIVITIDSPDFVTRVVKRVRRQMSQRPKLVHYVAPSVWAYRPKRARKFAALYDMMLALLPFEPPYFEKEGLRCVFTGHPAVEEWAMPGDGGAFKEAHRIASDRLLLGVFPGSRGGELQRHLPLFADVVRRLSQRFPEMTVMIPTVPHLRERVQEAVSGWPVKIILLTDQGLQQRKNAFAACTAALAKSGTVTLELALAGVPMAVTYQVNPITAPMIRAMLKTPFVTLVNLIQGREIIPELIQEKGTPEAMAEAVGRLLESADARKSQVTQAQAALAQLQWRQTPTPSERAAKAVLSLLS